MASFHLLMMKAVNWQPRCADLAEDDAELRRSLMQGV
jgi:hypothetical protein